MSTSSDSQRYQRIRAIFRDAIELDANEREAFLADTCADDTSLRRDVLALLDADDANDSFLESGAPPLPPDIASLPESIGPYRVTRLVGRGGMGVVFEAMQQNPSRRVAVKVLSTLSAGRTSMRRFRQETEVLGRLHHPGIAQIHDAGTDGERPYYVMEFVDGVSPVAFAGAHDLETGARLELVATICDAVHHAHQKGVIHRDIKPANILVTGDGQPKVLDFGIARDIGEDSQTVSLRTTAGDLVGTIAYMSPEQAAGDPDAIDVRTDVYALGVVAYELLCGRLPHDVRERPVPEAIHAILNDDPTSLSTVDRALRGDVETILLKSLAREKDRRYESAAALAADIRRYLSNEPIQARPTSAWYQARKFARRHRGLVAGVAGGIMVAFAAMVVATVVSINYANDARIQAGLADQSAADAQEQAEIADRNAADALWKATKFAMSSAAASLESGDVETAMTQLFSVPDDRRGFAWTMLQASMDESTWQSAWVPGPVGARILDDGRIAIVASTASRIDGSGDLFIFEPPKSAWVRRVTLDGGEKITATVISADGRFVAGVVDSYHGVRLWRTSDGALVNSLDGFHFARELAISDDGSVVYFSSLNELNVWTNPATPDAAVHERRDGFLYDNWGYVACSADGSVVGFGGPKEVGIIDRDGDGQRWTVGETHRHGIALSPDGQRLAVGARRKEVGVWRVGHDECDVTLYGFRGFEHTLCWPRADIICGADARGRLATWDSHTGRVLEVRNGGANADNPKFITTDGTRVLSVVGLGEARLWDDVGTDQTILARHDGGVYTVRFDGSGSRFATAGQDGVVAVHAADGRELARLDHDAPVTALAFFEDDSALLAFEETGHVTRHDLETGTSEPFGRARRGQHHVDVDDDAGIHVVQTTLRINSTYYRSRMLIDVEAGKRITETRPDAPMNDVRFSPDRSMIAAAEGDEIVLLDPTDGTEIDRLTGHQSNVLAMTWHPDGRHLIAGTLGTIWIWDLELRTPQQWTVEHGATITAIAIAPDGRTLATGGNSSNLILWDWAMRDIVLVLRGHESVIRALEFSPDGTQLLSASADGTVRRWDTRTVAERWSERHKAIDREHGEEP